MIRPDRLRSHALVGISRDLVLGLERKMFHVISGIYELHDSRSNSTLDMPAQSLHFQLFAVVPPLATRLPKSCQSSVPNFTTFHSMGIPRLKLQNK